MKHRKAKSEEQGIDSHWPMTHPPTRKINFNEEDALEDKDIATLAKAMEMSLKVHKLGKGDEWELQDLAEAIKRSVEDVRIKQAKAKGETISTQEYPMQRWKSKCNQLGASLALKTKTLQLTSR